MPICSQCISVQWTDLRKPQILSRAHRLFPFVSSQSVVLVDVHLNSLDGAIAVNVAASNGQSDVLRLLLQGGANPNRKVPKHKSALHAISTGHSKAAIACLELLLQFGGNPNLANDDGETPMHLAVSMIHTDTLKMLLQFGGNPNLANKSGETAVHIAAAMGGSTEAFQLLQGAANAATLIAVHNTIGCEKSDKDCCGKRQSLMRWFTGVFRR